MNNKKSGIKLLLLVITTLLLFCSVNLPVKAEKTINPEQPAKNDIFRGFNNQIPTVIKGEDGKKLYVIWGDIIKIDDSQYADSDILSLGSMLTIQGEVRGSIVAIGGSVFIKQGAVIENNLTILAGTLEQDVITQVRGKTSEIAANRTLSASLFTFLISLKIFLASLISYTDLFFALLLLIFAKKRIIEVCDRIVISPGKCLAWGMGIPIIPLLIFTPLFLLSFLGKWTIYIHLAISVLLMSLMILLLATSIASVAYLVGQTMEDRGWIGKREFIIKGIIGLLVITLILLLVSKIPIAGPHISLLIIAMVRLVGVGATAITWLSRTSKTGQNKKTEE